VKWTQAYVDSLPNSSFAYVSADGKKRSLPYKDKDGKVDPAHLRNALARLNQTDISADEKAAARKKLEAAAKKADVGAAADKKVKEAQALDADSFEERSAKISAALSAVYGDPWATGGTRWYVRATFDDAVVVEVSGDLKRFPLEFNSDGDVTLGSPEDVEVVYQALGECVGSAILGPLLEEGEGAKPGSKWAVVIVQEGLSANRTEYPAKVLREAVKLYEGVPVFWNHRVGPTASMPDPRDTAAVIKSPKVAVLEATGKTAIVATMHAITKEARERLLEAHEEGALSAYGLSHTVHADVERVQALDGKPATRVKAIRATESVDIVSFPSAGGHVMRLVAGLAHPVPVTEEDLMTFAQKLARLKESAPQLAKALSAEPTEAEVDALLRVHEAAPTPAAPASGTAQAQQAASAAAAPTAAAAAATVTDPPAGLTLTEAQTRELLLLGHRMRVDEALAGRTMPEKIKGALRESLISRVGLTEAQVKAEIDRFVEASAVATAPALAGTGLGGSSAVAELTKDEAEKILEGWEGFFFADAEPAVRAEHKRLTGKDPAKAGFTSLKEGYVLMTGDKNVSGRIEEARGLGRFQRVLEAIGTGTLSNMFASTMNRRLLAEYNVATVYQKWRALVSRIQPLNDFRNQERIRWGHFGDLAIVGENGTYTEFADPTDEKVSYAPQKRGKIVSISRETIKNDDVGFVRQLPMRIALAAARTLHKFVTNLVITNPTLDDSVALFAASTSRGFSSAGNIITTALSTANVSVARQRLLRVLDRDNQTVLELAPKILIVPPELEELAIRLTSIPVFPVSGQVATEPNYISSRYGLDTYVVLGTMADQNDWFILADPRLVDTIEIGFVDGQEQPTLLVQDMETTGSVFSADKWSYKVRHEYGGDVVEWRGMIGGVVP
jgi:hypothetical protein